MVCRKWALGKLLVLASCGTNISSGNLVHTMTAAYNKYKNTRIKVGDITFHSKAEADRYLELCLLQHAKEIQGLELQPRFKLIVNDVLICTYVADFIYYDNKHHYTVVEDVKGYLTKEYKIKAKLFQAIYGNTYKFLET